MAYTITLPPRVDISTVQALQEEWLSKVADQQEVVLDGHMVESFSTAGAQLVLALSMLLKDGGKSFTIDAPSNALRDDLCTLGLSEYA